MDKLILLADREVLMKTMAYTIPTFSAMNIFKFFK